MTWVRFLERDWRPTSSFGIWTSLIAPKQFALLQCFGLNLHPLSGLYKLRIFFYFLVPSWNLQFTIKVKLFETTTKLVIVWVYLLAIFTVQTIVTVISCKNFLPSSSKHLFLIYYVVCITCVRITRYRMSQ